jgi:hypothetical protein
MPCARSFAVLLSLVFGCAALTSAQSILPSLPPSVVVAPLSPDQERELDTWLSDMEKWHRYKAKYDNRLGRDAFGRIVPRRARPAEPPWLEVHCAAMHAAAPADRRERTARACALLLDPLPAADVERLQRQAAREDAETPEKHSSFLTRLHLDGAWVTTSSGPRTYGIVGFHVTLVDVGRVQIFGPPGVMLLSAPESGGNRRVTLGYTWGLSIRLADVRLAAPTRNMSLFLTMSKVWVNGGAQDQMAARSAQIVGLSLAPRKKR